MKLRFSHKLLSIVIFFTVLGIGATVYYAVSEEKELIGKIGLDDAARINRLAFENLYTSMRMGGTMDDNRAVMKRLREVAGVEDIRTIHAPSTDAQFGSEEDELPGDGLERAAIAGKEVYTVEKSGGRRVSRFVRPFFAEEECRRCHIAAPGAVLGAVSTRVSLEEYDRKVNLTVRNLIIGGAGILAVTLFLSVMFIRHFSVRPISELQKAARIIGAGNLDYRIEISDGLEINQLVEEFNSMAGSLKYRTEELNAMNKRLETLSITDGLTGVFNHRHFYTRLDEEIKRASRYAKPFSLIMLDIDHFKLYNDAHGHKEGDRILKEVAASLMGSLRDSDALARYGGEEFTVILPETGKGQAALLAERVRKGVEAHDFPDAGTQPGGRLTISLGVASYPEDGTTGDGIVEKADAALYRAKEGGRNRVEV
ncbi:MAG: diguanylate cyclase [Deltaproteobacteria bacterium]|nr:diguanylate cyclase [Deltaproteobacteria bacterium]